MGPQVAFAGTGFVCCQGFPLFNNDWCHLVRVGFKPFSGLVGLPAKNGPGGAVNSFLKVFPSIKRAWKRFVKRTCKFLHLTLSTGFAGVNERPSLLSCAIQFLCSHFYSAADEGIVLIAISTLMTAFDLDAGKAGENRVKLVPVLRTWVSPGDSVLGLGI